MYIPKRKMLLRTHPCKMYAWNNKHSVQRESEGQFTHTLPFASSVNFLNHRKIESEQISTSVIATANFCLWKHLQNINARTDRFWYYHSQNY